MTAPSLLAPAERRFPSKVDRWLLALILIPFAIAAVALTGVVRGDAPIWILIVLVAPQILFIWTLARTFYVVTGDALIVRSGPFRWSVRLDDIQSLAATRNPLSAPALSLDRIAVRHTGGLLLISPKDKEGFVGTVLTRAPRVAVTGLPLPPGVAAGRGDDVPEPKSTFSVAAIVPAVIVGVVSLLVGGILIYAGTRPPTATVSPRALSISGVYSTTIVRSEVVRIALEDALPASPSKRSGFAAAGELRGDFDVGPLGRCRLFITRDVAPYIVIHTATRPVIINFADPARTRALYDELQRTWQLSASGT